MRKIKNTWFNFKWKYLQCIDIGANFERLTVQVII